MGLTRETAEDASVPSNPIVWDASGARPLPSLPQRGGTGQARATPAPPKPEVAESPRHAPRHVRAMPAPRPRQCPVTPQGETAAGAGRSRTGRGAQDRLQRNRRGPDADRTRA
eukprot:gene16834-biopygen3815